MNQQKENHKNIKFADHYIPKSAEQPSVNINHPDHHFPKAPPPGSTNQSLQQAYSQSPHPKPLLMHTTAQLRLHPFQSTAPSHHRDAYNHALGAGRAPPHRTEDLHCPCHSTIVDQQQTRNHEPQSRPPARASHGSRIAHRLCKCRPKPRQFLPFIISDHLSHNRISSSIKSSFPNPKTPVHKTYASFRHREIRAPPRHFRKSTMRPMCVSTERKQQGTTRRSAMRPMCFSTKRKQKKWS